MNEKLNQLKSAILADGIIDADEVVAVRKAVYEDGKVDKEEADFIFELNDAVSGKNNHSSWKDLFVEIITDYVLKDKESYGSVDEEEACYLINKIQGDGKIDELEQSLLLNILANAKCVCDDFQDFVLSSFKTLILEDGVIDEAEVITIRSIIYSAGGASGAGVDLKEAEWLFELNDQVTGKSNHPSWKDLMVEGISKYVLEDEKSPNEVDDAEAEWLIGKIMQDGSMDDVEKAILDNIRANAVKLSAKLASI